MRLMFTFIWQYRSRFQSNATNVVLLGVWRSLVAHFLREEGVGGSNPLTPTSSKDNNSIIIIMVTTGRVGADFRCVQQSYNIQH